MHSNNFAYLLCLGAFDWDQPIWTIWIGWYFGNERIMAQNIDKKIEKITSNCRISTFRRIAPQVWKTKSHEINWHDDRVRLLRLQQKKRQSKFIAFISVVWNFVLQAIVTVIKNLIILNKSCFDGFASLIIPSLLGIAIELNPNESVQITANQASWLCKRFALFYAFFFWSCIYLINVCLFHFKNMQCIASFTFLGHPFGSLLSGFISDAGDFISISIHFQVISFPFPMQLDDEKR